MKVEVLWWLSGRAPATLGIVNWPLNTGWRFFFFAPCKGIRKFIACGIRNPGGDFAYGIWNPEFWNQEYRSRLESRIQVLLTNTGIQYLSGIGNPQRGIQNARLFRIPETGNFLLVESGILEVIFLMESGIQLKKSGIHWNPVPGIRNAESKTVLDSFTWDETNLRVNQENKDGDKAWHPNTSRYLYLFLCPKKVSKTDHWKDMHNVPISLLVSWF